MSSTVMTAEANPRVGEAFLRDLAHTTALLAPSVRLDTYNPPLHAYRLES